MHQNKVVFSCQGLRLASDEIFMRVIIGPQGHVFARENIQIIILESKSYNCQPLQLPFSFGSMLLLLRTKYLSCPRYDSTRTFLLLMIQLKET